MTKTGHGHDNVMGHRVISGLVFAAVCEKPPSIPLATRVRGAKRLGHKYERDFAKALKARYPQSCLAGQWFRFIDRNGQGFCQTDLLLKRPGEIIIFECKLTDTEKGRSQISRLYAPVVSHVFGLPVRGVVVARHLTRESELALITDQLPIALSSSLPIVPTLHWRERNPL